MAALPPPSNPAVAAIYAAYPFGLICTTCDNYGRGPGKAEAAAMGIAA